MSERPLGKGGFLQEMIRNVVSSKSRSWNCRLSCFDSDDKLLQETSFGTKKSKEQNKNYIEAL